MVTSFKTVGFEFKDFTNSLGIENLKMHFEPWIIEAIELFDDNIAIPPTYKSFNEDSYLRFENQRRSFCYNPKPLEYQNTICFKGCEVLSDDFAENLKALAIEGPSHLGLRLLEHFIIAEQKVPACLTYSEAIKEAEIALELQDKYYELYGEFAPLPLPIKVIKLPLEMHLNLEEKLKPITTKENLNNVISLLESQGLAIYMYIFPSFPMRVCHLDIPPDTQHPKERRKKLIELAGEPKFVIESWINLFSRLLCLGYLLGTTRSLFTGLACDFNNATLNGGFCDVGSIEKISDIVPEKNVLESIDLSFNVLCQTILSFLSGPQQWNRRSNFPLNYLKVWVYKKMSEEIRVNIEEGAFKAIASKYFNSDDNFDEMIDQFYSFY
jgi:hypothetical protein